MASRTNSQLKAIIQRYKEMYGKSLEDAVISETSGDLKKILVSLLQCNRSENTKPNEADMEAKAKQLYEAGEGKCKFIFILFFLGGTDESVFNRIFATASPKEMLSIAKHYHKLRNKTILDAIDAEFSGNMKKIYRTIVYALISPSEYFATRVMDACKGLGN
ncbi:MAG: hypothetical protein MJ252_31135 [archaeon]|nr:hypothetical protein [archaeon]